MHSPDCFAKMEIPTEFLFNDFFDDFFSKEKDLSFKYKRAEKI